MRDDTVAETIAWLDEVFKAARLMRAEVVDPPLEVLRWYPLCVPLEGYGDVVSYLVVAGAVLYLP